MNSFNFLLGCIYPIYDSILNVLINQITKMNNLWVTTATFSNLKFHYFYLCPFVTGFTFTYCFQLEMQF